MGCCGKLRTHGDRSPDRLGRSKLLFRLSYPGPKQKSLGQDKVDSSCRASALNSGGSHSDTVWGTDIFS